MLDHRAIAVACAAGLSLVTSARADDPKPYRVVEKFEVGGEGRWDYLTVDSAAHRLYVARQTHVQVLNADTGKLIGDIPNTEGVHGVALVPEFHHGFTSNGRANTVTIFDLESLNALSTVQVGGNPDAILFDPATKRVFTFNGMSRDTTAIDVVTGKVVGTLELGGKPEAGVSDGRGQIYVNIEDKSEVVRIDPKELKVTARWPIAPGEEPSGLALDEKNHRLFSACRNEKMVVLDAETGKVIATVPIGRGVDGAAFDSDTGNAFASNGDGTLTVVHGDDPAHYSVKETVTTMPGARTLAVDTQTHRIYLATARFETPASAPTSAPTSRRARPMPVPNSFTIVVVGR